MNIVLKAIKKILAFSRGEAYRMMHHRKLRSNYPLFCFSFGSINIATGSKLIIGRGAILQKHSELLVLGDLIIGESLNLNKYSRIVAHKSITIGDNVTIAQFVSILDHDHAYIFIDGKLELSGYNTDSVHIGSNVWIGDKVTITKGVSIGDNVIIGANSMVNKNLPSNCIAAGNPCRVIRYIYS